MSKDRFFSGGGQSEIDALNSDVSKVFANYTTVTGSNLNASDVFRFVKIGCIVVFNAEINYSASGEDRVFVNIPPSIVQTGFIARNKTTGALGKLWMGGTTISTYNGDITLASGQRVTFSGSYLTYN